MKNKPTAQSLFLRAIVYISALLTMGSLLLIVVYITMKGVPHLSLDLFSFEYNSENVSLFPALVNTISMTFLSLLIAAPLGIFSAIYLSEYARKDSKLVKLIRLTSETLAGIPSIVYGLFGSIFFVEGIFKTYCLIAGAFTVAIMILPVVMTTTEEALKSIPNSFREGSFGLGAGKLRTVFKIVLPSAVPGIFAGIVICVGRIVGETAALIYTAGTVPHIPENIFGSGRTLSVHMYALWNEGLNQNQAYASAVILLLSVIVINAISDILAKKLAKKF